MVSYFLTIVSLLLVLVTLPFSLLYTVKVVQVRFGIRVFGVDISATISQPGLGFFPPSEAILYPLCLPAKLILFIGPPGPVRREGAETQFVSI